MWVPAIREPIFKWFGIRCPCGVWFLRTEAYRRHYQRVHLHLEQ